MKKLYLMLIFAFFVANISGCEKSTQNLDTTGITTDGGDDLALVDLKTIDSLAGNDGIVSDYPLFDSTLFDMLQSDAKKLDATQIDTIQLDSGVAASHWAVSFGSNDWDYGDHIAVDQNGNTYITGYFRSLPPFGITVLTSKGSNDIFVAKLSPNGSVDWVTSAGGTSSDYGKAIALDISGNVYTTGLFQGQSTFGSLTLTSTASSDFFLAKFSPTGQVIWAIPGEGTSENTAYGLAVDSNGNSYITGYFYDRLVFGTATLSSNGRADIFTAKFNTAGQPLWAHSFGGSEHDYGTGIALDSTGNVYATGYFKGQFPFGSTHISSFGASDAYVVKYSSSGTPGWAASGGGWFTDAGRSIAVDPNGYPYITGEFEGYGYFGSTTLTSKGMVDVFVAKFSPTAGQLVWVSSAGGSDDDRAYRLAIDRNANSIVTGSFKSLATFGSTSITSASATSTDTFVAKFNSNGQATWAMSAGGTDADSGLGITVDKSLNAYVIGIFRSQGIFGTTTLTSNGQSDLFVWKITPP